MTTFESLLVDLAAGGVEYIVVGGLAVAEAGYVRVTDDVDLLIDTQTSNVAKLISVLGNFGEGHAEELSPEDFPLEEGCVRIAEDFDVDLFTIMSGQTHASLLPMTTVKRVAGQDIRFLSAQGLLLLKEGSVRPKDQMDVLMLRDLIRKNEQREV